MSTIDNINQMGTDTGYGHSSQPAKPSWNNNLPPMIQDTDPSYPVPPVIPISFFMPKDLPSHIADRLTQLFGSLLRSRFSVRYKLTGEPKVDLPIIAALDDLRPASTTIEIITPFGDFGKEYLPKSPNIVRTGYNAKRVTAALHRDWVEMKSGVRTFRSLETHTVLGKTGTSPAIALLTWSRDGSERIESLTPETKYNKYVYRLCKMFNVPIINLNDSSAIERLERIMASYPFVPE